MATAIRGLWLLLALLVASAAPLLHMVYPSAGTVLRSGRPTTAQWYSEDLPAAASVNLTLFKRGRPSRVVASNIPNSLSQGWSPTLEDEQGLHYQMQISSGSLSHRSPEFTIIHPFNFLFSQPVASSRFLRGTEQQILWVSSDTSEYLPIRIELMQEGNFLSIIEPLTSNDGVYRWLIPGDMPEANSCQVKISNYNEASEFWLSEVFTVLSETLALDVTSPSGETSALWFQSTVITWTNSGDIPFVDIYLRSQDGGQGNDGAITELGSGVPSNLGGSFTWEVGSDIPPGLYSIEVSDPQGRISSAISPPFQVKSAALSEASLEVTSRSRSQASISPGGSAGIALSVIAVLVTMGVLAVRFKRKQEMKALIDEVLPPPTVAFVPAISASFLVSLYSPPNHLPFFSSAV
ncbi:unnamed protein product [Chrysoparadoxa australica]